MTKAESKDLKNMGYYIPRDILQMGPKAVGVSEQEESCSGVAAWTKKATSNCRSQPYAPLPLLTVLFFSAPFPLLFLSRPWAMGQTFVNKCTHGVASYVVVRLLTTFVALITSLTGEYVVFHL